MVAFRGSRRITLGVVVAVAMALLGPVAAQAKSLPELEWSPTTAPGVYAFAATDAGSTATVTFALSNHGRSASADLEVELQGSASFSLISDGCSETSIGPRKSCSVSVQYAPAAPGDSSTATLVAQGKKQEATAAIALSGSSPKAAPTLTTMPNPTQASSGAVLKDGATLSGGYNPTGSITFTLTDPSNAVVDTENVPVSGNGSYSTPAGLTLPSSGVTSGTYQWAASYSGDGSNQGAQDQGGAAEQVSVTGKVTPVLTTMANPTSPQLTQFLTTLRDSATLSGGATPTGSITFTLEDPNSMVVDTETATVTGDGTYSTPTGYVVPATGVVAGTYQWVASYSGDGNNNAVSIALGDEPVNVRRAGPGVISTASPSAVTLNGSGSPTLTDRANLQNGHSPTGTITFTLTAPNGTTVDIETVTVSGNGLYTTPTGFTLPAIGALTGTYTWTAVYSGDSNNDGSPDQRGTREQTVVSAATPGLATAANPASASIAAGTTLRDVATLSGGYFPTGTITFTLTGPGNVVADTEVVTVSGNGLYTTPSGVVLPAGAATGTYQWTASYTGDGANATAASVPGSDPVTVGP